MEPLDWILYVYVLQALFTMAVSWIIGPAYNIAYMTPSSAVLLSGHCSVFTQWPDKVTQSAVGLLTIVVQFVLPLTLLVYGYVRMAIALHRRVVAARSTGLYVE